MLNSIFGSTIACVDHGKKLRRLALALALFAASLYPLFSSSAMALTVTEGAESGVVRDGLDAPDGIHSIAKAPAGWDVINGRYSADTASHSFRFLHEGYAAWPIDEWLLLPGAITPAANTKLVFKSMLGLVEAGESAVVQVSTSTAAVPPENSWVTVYSQSGSGHSVETTFQNREVSLGSYAGQAIRVRFVYAWNGTQGWYWQNVEGNDQGWSSGWYLDRIELNTGGAVTPIDGAENGVLKNGTNAPDGVHSLVNLPPGWEVINARYSADTASHSFRLLHEGTSAWPIDEWVMLPKAMIPAANSKLTFKSMLGLTEAGEIALVQVSTSTAAVPPENSWVNVFSQSGSGHNVETTFQSQEVSLASYAGQPIRIRFVYAWNGTQGWYWQNIEGNDQGWSSGWYFDRIEVTNVELSSGTPPQNAAPVAQNGAASATEDVAKAITLIATDANGDALTYSIVAQGTKGIAAITNAATGAVTYTPNLNANGSDSFTFKATDTAGAASNVATVTVTIAAANDAPVSQSGTLSVTEDQAKSGTLISSDVDGDALTFSVVAQGTKGAVTITNATTGAFTYTPNLNANGGDSFTFKATDTAGAASNISTIAVTIAAANDAPVSQSGTLSVTEDQAKTGTLIASDVDGDALTFSVVAQGTKGALTITNAATGAFTYTPNLNANGSDSFTFKATDTAGAASNVATITVTIAAANDAPVSQSGTLRVTEDQAKSGTLIASDVDGDALTFSVVAQGTKGAVTITNASTGAFTYTPNLNANGSDSFTFKATDTAGAASNVETVSVTILSVNDAPTISNIANQSGISGAVVGPVSFTVADVDSQAGSLVLTASSSNTLLVPVSNIVFGGAGNNRTVSIASTAGQTGQATISVSVSDGTASASSAFTFTVNPPAPEITSASTSSATKEQPFTYQIVATNSPTSYGATGLPSGLGINVSSGLISGTPTTTGTATVTLTAANGTGTGTATLTLTVGLSPQPPAISANPFSTGKVGQPFSYQIAASNSPTSYDASGLPTGLSVNAGTGLVSGIPTAPGQSSVTLTASNAVGADSKTLILSILPAAPAITSSLTASGPKGQPFSYQITASNGATSYGATGLPQGLGVDSSTGAISGTPTAAGAASVTLSAANAGGTDTKTLQLTIEEVSTLATLTVTLSPANGGAVTSGFAGSTSREVGTAYTIQANAAPGFVFAGWSGSASGSSKSLTFTMAQGFALQANFAPDPLLAARGEFNGLAIAEVPTHPTTGIVKITVGLAGRFTGRLTLAGESYPFAGTFDANGVGTFGTNKAPTRQFIRARSTPLDLALALNVTPGADRVITGTLSEAGAVVSSIVADQALFSDAKTPVAPLRNVPANLLGAYTFVIPASSATDVTVPRGNGWGRAVVLPNGTVRVSGTLADGVAITASTTLAQDGSFPLYVPLYRNGGAFCGQVTLSAQAGADVSGDVVWFRPTLPGRPLFPAGWVNGISMSLRGSHFRPIAAGLGSGTTPTPVTVTLSGGNLAATLSTAGSLTASSVTLLQPTAIRGFTFSVNLANGIFSGKFIQPTTRVQQTFRGVLLQNQNSAAGFFLGLTESGAITIAPNETN